MPEASPSFYPHLQPQSEGTGLSTRVGGALHGVTGQPPWEEAPCGFHLCVNGSPAERIRNDCSKRKTSHRMGRLVYLPMGRSSEVGALPRARRRDVSDCTLCAHFSPPSFQSCKPSVACDGAAIHLWCRERHRPGPGVSSSMGAIGKSARGPTWRAEANLEVLPCEPQSKGTAEGAQEMSAVWVRGSEGSHQPACRTESTPWDSQAHVIEQGQLTFTRTRARIILIWLVKNLYFRSSTAHRT